MAALNATGSNRVRLLGRAAVSYSKDSAQDAAFRMLNKMREPIAGAENSEQIFLEAQLELCEKFGIHQFRIAVMERIAEKNPGDIELRSRLAHLHLSVGSNDLALYHYLKIPEYVRDNNAWNNLGVANDRLELPAKGIEAYERSEALGETRATSNLALSLINAGFLTEAERRCRAALQVADCDENVGTTLAGVRKVVESENKKEDGLLTNAKRKSEFYRAVGRASALPLPADISGVWKGRNCSLIVKMVGNTFSASGSYVQPRNGLGALSIGFGTSLPPARMREEYTGSFLGRSIAASVTRTRDDDLPTTLLGSLDKRIDVQLLLNDDCTELNVMEGPQSPHPQFYSLFRGEM